MRNNLISLKAVNADIVRHPPEQEERSRVGRAFSASFCVAVLYFHCSIYQPDRECRGKASGRSL
jgi:hypothetical protein